ncbi:ATP-binding cassette domain-containing protein [Aeromicrobium sp. SMF47]|nr:ATP-binding cassette domain-containing protein [Aeromicrobium yanjiei]
MVGCTWKARPLRSRRSSPQRMPETSPPSTGLRLIARSLRRHRRRLSLGFSLIMVWQMCETLVPVLIGVIVDRGIAREDGSAFLLSLLGFAVLFAVLSNSYRFGGRLVVRSLEDEAHLLRTEVAGHVLHPRGARTSMLPGETLSVATSDAELVSQVMWQLAFAVSSMASVLVVAVYVLQVDLQLGLMILIGVPAVVILIQVVTPLVARRTHRQQQSTARTSGLAGDLVQGLRPLKGIGGEDAALRRYRASSQAARHDTIGVARSWGYLLGMTTGLSGILLALVTLVAGTLALDGQITLGQLIALVGLTQFLAEPISALGDISAQFAASRASAGRIADFLATPRIVPVGDRVPHGDRPQLRVDAVGDAPLDGLSFATRDGELLAITIDDPTTSDALVHLLAGTAGTATGSVTLGDVPLAELTIESRRENLLVSPHHTEIFEGTLRSAIDPDDDLTPAELDEVLAASAVDDVVALHPDGLDRPVRAGGSSLSGGQRQRVALARALAAAPPLLVLQDPTSAVDGVTEHAIAAGLRDVRGRRGHTTVVITSSPAMLQQADRVLFVQDGRVVAEGPHGQLIGDPSYREAVLR